MLVVTWDIGIVLHHKSLHPQGNKNIHEGAAEGYTELKHVRELTKPDEWLWMRAT